METRTSMPSPWRRRVADARAASSASKIISLSTPFSLETASTTIRISLFILRTPAFVRSGFRRHARLVYSVDRQLHRAVIHFQNDLPVSDFNQSSGESLATIQWRTRFDSDALATKASEMFRRPQHTIETRRRNLERVLRLDRIRRIQDLADGPT